MIKMINIKYRDLIPNLTLDDFFESNKDKVETRAISFYLNPKNKLDDDTRIKPMQTHDYTGIFVDFRAYNKDIDNIIPYGGICMGSKQLHDAFIELHLDSNDGDYISLWIRKISDFEITKMANNGLSFVENYYKVGAFTNELI